MSEPNHVRPGASDKASQAPGSNGAAHCQANSGASAAGSEQPQPQVERAEEIVDRLAERVAHYTSVWGRQLWRASARIREEAEDLWAEAQSIRRGDQS